jgi:hypothetical protein
MANTNNFKPFAVAANANVTEQADWETLPALSGGFSSGKASSAQVNKGLRQSTTIAAVVGQFIANSGVDALDNGDINGLVTKFSNAILKNLNLADSSGVIGRLVNVKKITTSGTYTPSAGVKFCIAEVQAGGGGGGSAATCATGQSSGGGGGAAGGYGLIKFAAASAEVVIGSGGAGGPANASGAQGSDGGSSSIAGFSAPGGAGGWAGPARSTFPQGNNTSGRSGASSNTGSAIVFKDVSGQAGQGGIAYGAQNAFGGGGGSSPLGTGSGGGISTSVSTAGTIGSLYGSGGGGSSAVAGTSSIAGGAGAQGVVIIWEYA